jgi:hypothetical protein
MILLHPVAATADIKNKYFTIFIIFYLACF